MPIWENRLKKLKKKAETHHSDPAGCQDHGNAAGADRFTG